MLAFVQPHGLFLFGNAQGEDEIDEFKDEERHGEAISHRNGHGFDLDEEESGVAVQQTVAALGVYRFCGENSGHYHANHASNSVAGEHIERIVEARFGFIVHSGVGNDRRDHADEYTLRDGDITGRRRDGNEANNGANAETKDRRFFAFERIEEHPGQTGGGSGCIGGGKGRNGEGIGRTGGTRVETEPSKPQKACADEHIRDVCRRNFGMSDMNFAPFEHHGASKGRAAGRNVNNRASGEIKGAHFGQKTLRMPRPMRQRGINEEAEEHAEEHIGRKLDALRHSAHHKARSDDGEHQLEERKERKGDGWR